MAGIIDTIKLAGTLVFALPAALAGVHLLIGGRTFVGVVLIGLAAALLLVQHRLTTPGDVPGLVAKRAAGAVVEDSNADSDGDSEEPDDVIDVPREEDRS